MKKRYRLKKWVKDYIIGFLVSVGFIALFVFLLQVYSYRIEQINNGSMVLVSDSECDR